LAPASSDFSPPAGKSKHTLSEREQKHQGRVIHLALPFFDYWLTAGLQFNPKKTIIG
jgi:hypothetical protein